MITQIDSNNEALYKVLFEEASAQLSTTITDLSIYFNNLPALADIDTKYMMLPLDEELFEINAEKRTITIPPFFRKNGVGVQGDETAEVIYFKINRYYEFIDLNNTVIYIQWQLENGEEGISIDWNRQIKVAEDGNEYLIFGWPLGITNITENSGLVKFSIHFIKQEEQENKKVITYSLNTLVSQIIINPSLVLDINNLQIDTSINDKLKRRLQ